MNGFVVIAALFGISGALFLPIRKTAFQLSQINGKYEESTRIVTDSTWSDIAFSFLAFGQIGTGFLYEIISQFVNGNPFSIWLVLSSSATIAYIWVFGFSIVAITSDHYVWLKSDNFRAHYVRFPVVQITGVGGVFLYLLGIGVVFLGVLIVFGFKTGTISVVGANNLYLANLLVYEVLPALIGVLLALMTPRVLDYLIEKHFPDLRKVIYY